MKFICGYITFLCALCASLQLNAQLEFNMRDTTVNECKGILYDSGGEGLNYQHNSNLAFTICLDAPGTLTLGFDNFCVESTFDSLTFHLGPNEFSPQVGPAYSGTQIPPSISITSGCLTLHFVSDANVACNGWIANWTTQVVPPVPPQIAAVLPVPACSSNTAIVNLSKKLACDSIYASAFNLLGPLEQSIIAANPINCIGDSAQQLAITFAEGINLGGMYTLELVTNYRDACDSIWTFTTTDDFDVFDCPIVVNLIPENDSLCSGQCTNIIAEVTGGNGVYTYSWSNGLPPTAGPQQVCPTTNATYTLTVDDTSPAVASSGSASITVFAPANVPAPSIHCQSEAPFLLSASPSGGWWTGAGITDTLLGEFTGDSALAGLNLPGYYLPITPAFGCTTFAQVTVLAIDAGIAQAACPGSSPFQISGFSPGGGVWTGAQVSSTGIFDPSAEGEYSVTYSVNGCSEDLTIYVDDIEQLPTILDSLCESDASISYQLTPFGGRWYGPGIVDSLNGTFDPGESGAGLITLTYALNGCSQDIPVFVKEIWAGWNFTACPTQDDFVMDDFAPVGGVWSGTGILNATTGLFDPGYNNGNAFTEDLIYAHPNGCTDTATVYVFFTRVYNDTQVFCSGDGILQLNRTVMDTNPWEGDWSGAGVLYGSNADSSRFDPQIAGPGLHYIVFDVNTCSDTAYFYVQSSFMPDVASICEAAPEIQLSAPDFASNGTFNGPGITNPLGTFLPADAGEGIHLIEYESIQGCRDTFSIEVENFQQASISATSAVLCYSDTLYPVSISPQSATVIGSGFVAPNFFNPILTGEGEHWLIAEIGSGFCRSVDSTMLTVGPAISYSLFVSKDTLCFGDYSTMLINAFGGNGSNISYQWNQGLPPLQQQNVSPASTTNYYLAVTDGCSLLRDTVNIVVQPPIVYSVTMSETACFGETGFAQITGPGDDSPYNVQWRNQIYPTPANLPGLSSYSYNAVVIDTITGCRIDTLIQIPGYPLVKAQFSVNPNLECIPSDLRDISFIDLSTGAHVGTWSFGDGTVIDYEAGINPFHEYIIHGEYTVVLDVADTNGCDSKTERQVCILEPFRIYLPTAFTPNADSMNDGFGIQGTGILKADFYVYDRRGVLMFQSSAGEFWDAKYKGNDVPSGVFGWVAEVQWLDKTYYTTAGTVTVIR